MLNLLHTIDLLDFNEQVNQAVSCGSSRAGAGKLQEIALSPPAPAP
jgi:hypothetical protein